MLRKKVNEDVAYAHTYNDPTAGMLLGVESTPPGEECAYMGSICAFEYDADAKKYVLLVNDTTTQKLDIEVRHVDNL